MIRQKSLGLLAYLTCGVESLRNLNDFRQDNRAGAYGAVV